MIIFAIPPSGELKLTMVVNSRQGSQTDFDYLGASPTSFTRLNTQV